MDGTSCSMSLMLQNFVNQVQDIMLLHLNVRIEVRIHMEGSSIVLHASNQRQCIFPTFYHYVDNEIKAFKRACVCLREFSGFSDSKIKPINLLALALASHIDVF
jgi:hypothetical protein